MMHQKILEKAFLLFSPFRKRFSVTSRHLAAYFQELSRFEALAPYLDLDSEEAINLLKTEDLLEAIDTPLKDVQAVAMASTGRESFRIARQKPEASSVLIAYMRYYGELARSLWDMKRLQNPKQQAIINDFIRLEIANFEHAGLLTIGEDPEAFYFIQNVLGFYLIGCNDFEQAIAYTTTVLERHDAQDTNWLRGSSRDIGLLYRIRADALYKTGQWKRATRDFEQCVKRVQDLVYKANALREWGGMEMRLAHHTKALELLDAAIAIYTDRDLLLDRSSAIQDKTYVLERLGRIEEARDLLVAILELYEDKPDTQPLASQALNGLAILYNNQKDYVKAKAFHKRALSIDGAYIGRDLEKVQGLLNLSIACMALQEYPEAEKHLKDAIALHYSLPDHILMGNLKQTLGQVAYATDRIEEAIEHTREAADLYSNRSQQADCFYNLGHFYKEQERYEASLEAFEAAKNLYKEVRAEKVGISRVCEEQSIVCEIMGHASQAFRYQQEAVDYATDSTDKIIHWTNLAMVQAKFGYVQEATETMEAVRKYLEHHPNEEAMKVYEESLERLRKDLEDDTILEEGA